jgi:hypothetical protein
MHQMPVVGKAVLTRVLAHRRDCNAVAKSDSADGEGREEIGHLRPSGIPSGLRRLCRPYPLE